MALHALSKTALEAVTQAEAKPAFKDGIRVYGLIESRAPGARSWDDLVSTTMDAANTDVMETVWSSALFLASERGSWMNGATLSIGE